MSKIDDETLPDTQMKRSVAVSLGPAPRAGRFGPPSHPGDLGSFGPYRIVKPLGKGAMGTVYLAIDTRLNRSVALKLCHVADKPQALERFRREAHAAASLRHPHLCPVYECDVLDGAPYFTMAFIEGATLDQWVDERKGLSQQETVALVRKLALALQYAHEHGVIHRDLKPSNIGIERDEPVILDFGLARVSDDDATQRLTKPNLIMGTPAYMPPEQARGDRDAMGPACDIYSLGAIFYELLAGEPPFVGPALAVMSQVIAASPPSLRKIAPDVDRRLEAMCLKCLAKDPTERWESMAALAAALDSWTQATSVKRQAPRRAKAGPGNERETVVGTGEPAQDVAAPSKSMRPSSREQKRQSRRRLSRPLQVLAAAGVGLLAVLLAAGVAHWKGRPPREAAEKHFESASEKTVEPATPPVAGLQVLPPPHIGVQTRNRQPVTVRVVRMHYSGPITLEFLDLPPGVDAAAVQVPEGKDGGTLELKADADAVLGSAKCRIVARAGDLQAVARVLIDVESSSRPAIEVVNLAREVKLIPGDKAELVVQVKRQDVNGAIAVQLVGLPAKVSAKPVAIAENAERATVEISAAMDSADLGDVEKQVRMVLTAGKLTVEHTVNLAVTAKPRIRIVQAPAEIVLRAGEKKMVEVVVERRSCKGPVQVRLQGLPPGIVTAVNVVAADRDRGKIQISAAIDRAERDDLLANVTLQVALGELSDVKPIKFKLEKRPTLTAAGSVAGFLEEIDDESWRIAVGLPPPTGPVQLKVAPGVQVRLRQAPPVYDDQGKVRKHTPEELKTLKGEGNLPGYRGVFADLQLRQFVRVDLGKGPDQTPQVRTIVVLPTPQFVPPPPPKGKGKGKGKGF